MPKDKKANLRQQHKYQKARKPGGANNYFETAEELASRHQEATEQGRSKLQKKKESAENPEEPQQ